MRNFILSIGCFCLVANFDAQAATKSDPVKLVQQAEKRAENGDYEGAQTLYEQVLKENPDFEPALFGLGEVHYWQGNYQQAIDAYAKILAYESDHVKALIGTGKAYLAVGKQKKAQEYFNRAEKAAPDNEGVEAMEPQLARKTRLAIDAGYITENPSYATQVQGEFQEIRITKERTYSFGLRESYFRKFSQDAFDTRLFGSYYVMEDTRLDFALSFAPRITAFPRQSYEVGLAQTIWKITPEVHYNFQDYKQANLQTVKPAFYFEPFDFLRFGGGYEFQNLMVGTTSKNFHGGFVEISIMPLELISIHGFYSKGQRGFEAGRTTGPFVNYKAHIGGGGISVNLMENYRIGFDALFEDRNNGETSESYTTSVGYFF